MSRALSKRYGRARKRATPAESRRNFATLVEQLLVRDFEFRPGEAAVSVQNFGSMLDEMHDAGEFPSSAALRIARFENEESVIPRRGHARYNVRTMQAFDPQAHVRATRMGISSSEHATVPGVYPGLEDEAPATERFDARKTRRIG